MRSIVLATLLFLLAAPASSAEELRPSPLPGSLFYSSRDPRAEAMGRSSSVSSSGVASLFDNPAALASLPSTSAELSLGRESEPFDGIGRLELGLGWRLGNERDRFLCLAVSLRQLQSEDEFWVASYPPGSPAWLGGRLVDLLPPGADTSAASMFETEARVFSFGAGLHAGEHFDFGVSSHVVDSDRLGYELSFTAGAIAHLPSLQVFDRDLRFDLAAVVRRVGQDQDPFDEVDSRLLEAASWASSYSMPEAALGTSATLDLGGHRFSLAAESCLGLWEGAESSPDIGIGIEDAVAERFFVRGGWRKGSFREGWTGGVGVRLPVGEALGLSPDLGLEVEAAGGSGLFGLGDSERPLPDALRIRVLLPRLGGSASPSSR